MTAWAAKSTFAADMGAIPVEAMIWVLVLSFIGGAAFTANKISRPNIILKSALLEVIKDLLMAVVAGLVTFFIGSWLGIAYWLQAAFITLAGYAGSRILDKYMNNVLFNWADKISPPGEKRERPNDVSGFVPLAVANSKESDSDSADGE